MEIENRASYCKSRTRTKTGLKINCNEADEAAGTHMVCDGARYFACKKALQSALMDRPCLPGAPLLAESTVKQKPKVQGQKGGGNVSPVGEKGEKERRGEGEEKSQ